VLPAKAPEGRRTPRRFARFASHIVSRQRFEVRQSSAAFPTAKYAQYANGAQNIFPCRPISRGSRLSRLIHIFNLFPMVPVRKDKIISKSLSDLAFGVRVWGDGLIQH
jgi:hypothetical protein